jgi:hypothetical protein
MLGNSDLHIEVQGGGIVITAPGTRYTVTYHKPTNSPQLLAKSFPMSDDRHALMTNAEFLVRAWKAANDTARRLGWIV